MTSPYRLVDDKSPFQKSASNSQLKQLGVLICGEAGRVGFEIKFYRLTKVGFQFIHGLSLSATTRKRRNFCPKSAFISLVNDSSYFHEYDFKPNRRTGKNGH